MILAGDIGGTKSHLALFAEREQQLRLLEEDILKSGDYPGLETVIQTFLVSRVHHVDKKEITAACFGAACPVVPLPPKTSPV